MKISVIISTYNRFDSLLKAIESVKNQTYAAYEIIVINDNSTDIRYNSFAIPGVEFINLKYNTRKRFGFPCAGYVRSVGIEFATGEYIAILDDDDYYMPNKLAVQITEMKTKAFEFSATEGLMGYGTYENLKEYPIYHREYYKTFCEDFFSKNYSAFEGKLPEIFNSKLIEAHNFIIHSSVIFSKKLYTEACGYENVPNGEEDLGLFKRMLKITNCLHLNTPLVYYSGKGKY